MIQLSEIVVAGLLEAFVILLVALVIVLTLNHRLHKKRSSLSTQLGQLKETTVFLLDKVNEYSAYTYGFFLDKAVEQAKHDTEVMLDTSHPDFTCTKSEKEKAALIRYLLLDAERAAESETSEEAKAALREARLTSIVHDIEAAAQAEATSVPAGFGSIDEADFKSKWGHLCDAALELIASRSSENEEELVDIIRVLNADLELDEILIPTREAPEAAGDIIHVREESDRNKEIIAKLLAERNAAEAEVNVKVTELERLQRFLKESEWCMNQLDDDYQAAKAEIKKLREANEMLGGSADMDQIIQKFNQESSEMLICIETLEQENSDLKNQLGLN